MKNVIHKILLSEAVPRGMLPGLEHTEDVINILGIDYRIERGHPWTLIPVNRPEDKLYNRDRFNSETWEYFITNDEYNELVRFMESINLKAEKNVYRGESINLKVHIIRLTIPNEASLIKVYIETLSQQGGRDPFDILDEK